MPPLATSSDTYRRGSLPHLQCGPEQPRNRRCLCPCSSPTFSRKAVVAPRTPSTLRQGFAVVALQEPLVLQFPEGGVDAALNQTDLSVRQFSDPLDDLKPVALP